MMNDETDIELPQALIDRLEKQDRSVAMLTPQVDRAIAAAAEEQFRVRGDGVSNELTEVNTPIPQTDHDELSPAGDAVSVPGQLAHALSRGTNRSARRPHRSAPWGLAAAAAAAVVFIVVALREPGLAGDFDGSGSIDVLDAFALSRELEQDPRFAANETVDSLMARIVALDGGAQ
jgi:hypothetical protein